MYRNVLTTVVLCLLSIACLAQGQYITVYQDANYKGEQKTFRAGERIANLGNGEKRKPGCRCHICNDDISSLSVPRGLKVTVYEDQDFRGRSRVITEDCAYLGSEWNDKISSLIVEQVFYEPVITFYQDANFMGDNMSFRAGDQMRDIAHGRKRGSGCTLCNDDISSVRVPMGLRVTVFEDENFQGRSRIITSDCSYVGTDWNDRISSFFVEQQMQNVVAPPPPPPIQTYPVIFYQDANYGGDHMSFNVGDRIALVSNGQKRGSGCVICNDDISSIKVPFGLKVTVYTDKNFNGFSKVITSDCPYVGNGFNDKISSFTIEYADGYNGGR